jgi:PPM family protein phosphatase
MTARVEVYRNQRGALMEWTEVVPLGDQTVHLRVGAASDVGNVRSVNEDSFLTAPSVFLVADGMGGHAHGDRASREVVRVFTQRHSGETSTTAASVIESIRSANDAVRELTPSDATDAAIAGTTVTGIALIAPAPSSPAAWMAFNVGDSRTYQWQANELIQVTVDHSAVQELVDSGEITAAEAEKHPERNVVTRALGVDDEAEADVWLIPSGGRQLFVMCSDGLTKELSDGRIAELVRDSQNAGRPSGLADRLVAAAVAAGGRDNVTVVVVDAEWSWASAATVPDSPSSMPAFLEETAPRS